MSAVRLKPVLRQLRSPMLPSHTGSNRLFFINQPFEITYKQLATQLRSEWRGSLIVLDSSFVGRHEIDPAVWEAMLESAILFPRYAWDELKPWRENPFANKTFAAFLAESDRSRNPAIIFDHQLGWSEDYKYGRAFYNSLLGQRKSRSRSIVTAFEERMGRASRDNELNELFTANGTARDFHLLRKGFAEYGSRNFFADEDVLVTAAMAALHRGRPTIVLTRDGDLLDQFHKLWSLLTCHYQALLFAELHDAMPETFLARPIPWGQGKLDSYFVTGEGFLVRKPVHDPAELTRFILPIRRRQVPVACLLLGGQPPLMKAQLISFAAEKDMASVIRAKGATAGRVTTRSDGLNCHVTGLPAGVDSSRHWVAFATDRVMEFANSPLRLPLLDIGHAIEHAEGTRMATASTIL
jgi:hypothetical protein